MSKFVTSLRQPWALIKAQGDGSPGRRPASRMAWLEYDNGNYIEGWVLDRTWRLREADGSMRAGAHPSGFVRRYRRPTKIYESDILYRFPHQKNCGPSKAEEAAARRNLPKIPEFESAPLSDATP